MSMNDYYVSLINKLFPQVFYPKSLDKISILDTNLLLKYHFPKADIHLSDANFSLTSKEEAEKYVLQSSVYKAKYVSESHDCDNYSFAMQGYWSEGLESFAFGIAWSNLHAFNIMIDSNKDIWVIEPQTGKFMTLQESKINKMYDIQLIIM